MVLKISYNKKKFVYIVNCCEKSVIFAVCKLVKCM